MENFRLFDESSETKLGLDFLEFPEESLPPPPPSLEIFPSQVSSSVKYTVESVNLDGISLLKGRVRTQEVFALSNLDLVPGKYEGGLKLWEGSLDLVKTLRTEVQDGKLSIIGKRVLELGCGHGLPGIFACLMGASVIHFQDFNSEVLECLTIPNVNANMQKKSQSSSTMNEQKCDQVETRFFAGDWNDMHRILPHVLRDEYRGNRDEEPDRQPEGYDIILMAETVYSVSSLPNLYKLIKNCLSRPHGVVYMAAKKHYFGVGGGSRSFVSLVEKDCALASTPILEVADGSSNVREVWRFSYK